MNSQNNLSGKKKTISLKATDNLLCKIKNKAAVRLTSVASVISDCLLPKDKPSQKLSAEKRIFLKKALFHFFLSFALGLSGTPAGGYPFGISTLFAFSDEKYAFYIFTGCLASGALCNSAVPVRLTVYLLIFLLRKTFTAGKFNEKNIFRISCSFLFSLFLSLSATAGTGISLTGLFYMIFSTTLCTGSVYLFRTFFDFGKKASASVYYLSLYAVFACTIPSFRLFSPFGIDLSLIYAGILILFFAKIKGPVYGCVAGFIFGFLCSNPLYCAPLGTAGLISGYLFTKSFIISCISFSASSMFCALYLFGFDSLSSFLPFIITSGLIFMLIGTATPDIFNFPTQSKQIPKSLSHHYKNDSTFGAVSDSLSGLSNILYKFAEHLKSPSYAETGDIFDNAFNEICSKCSMNTMCYAKRECSFEKVHDEVIEILRTDILKEDSLSKLLLNKCIKSNELCDYINRHYSELRYLTMKANRTGTVACLYNSMSRLIRTTEKEQWAKNERDTRIEKALCESLRKIGIDFTYITCIGTRSKDICVYGIRADKIPCSGSDLSTYLSKQIKIPLNDPVFDISENGSMVMKLSRRQIIGCEYAQCCASKENEDVNGDTVSLFDSDASFFYSIIADGMGSGKAAAATSRLTCVFLEKLLCAGTKKNVCLELLNNLLLSKNDETFSGVDLLEIDKLNSSAYFIKAGAASSYILRGMKLYKIRSDTPPVGIIHAFSAESTSFAIEKGDCIIMLSDGVTGADEDERWLSELIRLDTKDEPAVLASTLIERAKELSGANDDMSAVVIKII